MDDQTQPVDVLRYTLRQFCHEYVTHPYLCYTEHGLHALFYTRLYNALPDDQRYIQWGGYKVCMLQKEYPTAGSLGKPRRQHWDVAMLANPPGSRRTGPGSFDYLRLAAVVEFAMNESVDHLLDDIDRLCDAEANTDARILVHLYRLSQWGALFSARDWSPRSPRIRSQQEVADIAADKPVEIYYGMADSTGTYPTGVWHIHEGHIAQQFPSFFQP